MAEHLCTLISSWCCQPTNTALILPPISETFALGVLSRAGAQIGDVLVAVDDVNVLEVPHAELISVLRSADDTMRLTIVRCAYHHLFRSAADSIEAYSTAALGVTDAAHEAVSNGVRPGASIVNPVDPSLQMAKRSKPDGEEFARTTASNNGVFATAAIGSRVVPDWAVSLSSPRSTSPLSSAYGVESASPESQKLRGSNDKTAGGSPSMSRSPLSHFVSATRGSVTRIPVRVQSEAQELSKLRIKMGALSEKLSVSDQGGGRLLRSDGRSSVNWETELDRIASLADAADTLLRDAEAKNVAANAKMQSAQSVFNEANHVRAKLVRRFVHPITSRIDCASLCALVPPIVTWRVRYLRAHANSRACAWAVSNRYAEAIVSERDFVANI